MISDLRVCFLGDSFTAGVGDPEHLGWVGRIAARSDRGGQPLTAYNLGVRRRTSRDVLDSWRSECAQRLPTGSHCRLVLSFGVNDTTHEYGVERVPPAESSTHLADILKGARSTRWPVLIVGPPPVRDRLQNNRIENLDGAFSAVCSGLDLDYVSVLAPLLASPVWMEEVARGDGSHPGAAGYDELAGLIWPRWCSWLGFGDRGAA